MFLGLPRGADNAPTIPDHLQGRFDCVMGTGVYYEGHIPKEGFLDAYDMLKIGGHFCFGIRKYYWVDGENFGYKDAIESLISEGKVEIKKTWTHTRGFDKGSFKNSTDERYGKMEHIMIVIKKIA